MTEPTGWPHMLPCPFCGGDARHYAHADDCYFILHSKLKHSGADMSPALEALAAWNRRVAPATMLGEPVFAFRRKGLDDFCTCTEKRYAELSLKPKLFETRIFYTTPQPTQAQAGAVESAEFGQFLSDVLTAAGLVTHGKQCKALGERLADMCVKLRHHGIKGGQHGADT